ncbi:MAG: dodecin family protein [Xanthomonadales bacterium]|nr:dodecin family protein [Xanthomonadales bacterium]
MSVVKFIEISASSDESIESAVKAGLAKVARTVRHICGAWINDIKVVTHPDGTIREWRVNMRVSFEVD